MWEEDNGWEEGEGEEEENLYDEFGNYIGGGDGDLAVDEEESSDEGEEEEEEEEEEREEVEGGQGQGGEALVQYSAERAAATTATAAATTGGHEIVLHEDKQLYPSAEEVYRGVKTVVLDEDAQPLEEPLVAPDRRHRLVAMDMEDEDEDEEEAAVDEQKEGMPDAAGGHAPTATKTRRPAGLPRLVYEHDFAVGLAQTAPRLMRNVAVVGHLHHGKTALLDVLVRHAHVEPSRAERQRQAQRQKQMDNRGVAAAARVTAELAGTLLWDPTRAIRYTDVRVDEQERCISLKATPISLVMQTMQGKSHLVNIADCPGHVNFIDEPTAAMRLADGVVLVVDALEGVMLNTELMIRQAVLEGLPISLVITKLDRLILELKLPPQDAYYKLVHTIAEVNNLIAAQLQDLSKQQQDGAVFADLLHNEAAGFVEPVEDDAHNDNNNNSSSSSSSSREQGHKRRVRQVKQMQRAIRQQVLCPTRGNVLFASGMHGYVFSLRSFAKLYVERQQAVGDEADTNDTVNRIAANLWGDVYRAENGDFSVSSQPPEPGTSRTFISLILEPLYKIYSHVVGEEPEQLVEVLEELGVHLTRTELHMNVDPLLRIVLSRFFGGPTAFADMVAKHVPNPVQMAARKVARHFTGLQTTPLAQSMRACDPEGPLMAHCTKLIPAPNGQSFHALVRVYSGTLEVGAPVSVLGESYCPEDDEDMRVETVASISLSGARYTVPMTKAVAGSWVLLSGIDALIQKTATICNAPMTVDPMSMAVFAPLRFQTQSTVKLAVEPLHPSDLPKMVEALRRANKSYPLLHTKVEESGEHVILGSGELYMDCIMHDIRHLFSDIEVKVADPCTCFRETVIESSAFPCFAETPNKRNRLTMSAQPLDKGLAEDLDAGMVRGPAWDDDRKGRFFERRYGWDHLAARAVWAFGPDADTGPNAIVDDTLHTEVNKSLLNQLRTSVVQGFQWACREGPLCDEPLRNTKFKIMDAIVATEPIHRGGGQVIPTARRVAYSAFLTAMPRLMEPVYRVQVQAPSDIVSMIYPLFARRRGHVEQDAPKPGTPFYTVRGYLPIMDSFGFETDLRTTTQGQAHCSMLFDHWSVVPGDPLDRALLLEPLEPSPAPLLARDFMIKTRRRKGLTEDVGVSKYFDVDLMAEVNEADDDDDDDDDGDSERRRS